MRCVLKDLQYGLRLLGRAPGFTTVAVLCLAVGIGANTAVFSVLKAPSGVNPLSMVNASPGEAGTSPRVLGILLGAVALILIMACMNVANLLLARGWAREREMFARWSMGASRSRLITQMLTESLCLGLLGGGLGIILSLWARDGLLGLIPGHLTLQVTAVPMDGTVVGYALALSVASGLAFGIVPAFHASRLNIFSGQTGARVAPLKLRGALLVLETATALILLSVAGLLVPSARHVSPEAPDTSTTSSTARSEGTPIDPGQSAPPIRTFKDATLSAFWSRRILLLWIGMFAALALALGALGTYGLVTSAAARRTREFGIRMALGADRALLLRMALRQGMIPVLTGVGIGLAGAAGLSSLMSGDTVAITSRDASTFLIAALLLVLVGLVASYIPARRAANLDPMSALRDD